MQTNKQLCRKIARTVLGVAGGMLMLTAIGAVAVAQGTPTQTPEIDPTSIAGAVTLFMGSVMLLTARRKLK